ncbi:rod shape-determining protein MreB [human gut metagenome]|uniref:Rod shape-determining protein MreB n=1 Tax=human gut metagenome TaxID=408170 RepID=K1TQN3_9ZZZZ
MLAKDVGIDLGTANILIYVKGEGIVLNEPSIVVVDTNENKVIAMGNEAKEMIGKTPENIKVIKPLKDGVIADFEITELMLNNYIKRVKAKSLLTRPRVLICCPSNITEVEKSAIIEAAERTGARKVFIEEEPKVAAIGAGIKIKNPTGNMVIDIGGGTTDIAVLSMNNIVISSSLRIAGNTFDQDIINYIREKYQVLIGERTAEDIKINFANVYKPDKKKELIVKGRNLITGLPITITINQEDTAKALEDSIKKIVSVSINVLENTPPELAADIVDKGVILTGGGSLLRGLQKVLKQNLKIPVLIAQSPLTCVVEGTKVLLDDIKSISKCI